MDRSGGVICSHRHDASHREWSAWRIVTGIGSELLIAQHNNRSRCRDRRGLVGVAGHCDDVSPLAVSGLVLDVCYVKSWTAVIIILRLEARLRVKVSVNRSLPCVHNSSTLFQL